APGDGAPAEVLGRVVGHVQLATALPGVSKRDPYCCALSVGNFDAGHVGDEYSLAGQSDPPSRWKLPSGYAAARDWRIFHERSRLSNACSSKSSPISRAPTTRKCLGRKSSIVRPSRYCSITAGLTYEARATAGVFPSRSPTERITAAILRFDSASVSATPRSASPTAASSVPPQVRKSLAVNSSPMYSWM